MARLDKSQTRTHQGAGRKTKFSEVLSLARAAEAPTDRATAPSESSPTSHLDEYADSHLDDNADRSIESATSQPIVAYADSRLDDNAPMQIDASVPSQIDAYADSHIGKSTRRADRKQSGKRTSKDHKQLAEQSHSQLDAYPPMQIDDNAHRSQIDDRQDQVNQQLPPSQLAEQPPMHLADNAPSQLAESLLNSAAAIATPHSPALPDQPIKSNRKTGKRSDPNYTGVYFSIPKDLNRSLDRFVIDLADKGHNLDRSQVISLLLQALIQQSSALGVQAALENLQLHQFVTLNDS